LVWRNVWRNKSVLTAFVLVRLLCAPVAAQRAPQKALPAPTVDPALLARLHWRHIGPAGNRVSAVAGVPGDPLTVYAGAASGGVWKTTDGGIHWMPIFDDQPVQSIGALAVAPSDANTVWAGTGESFIRSNISLGDGIYKSTDAGKTWKRMGLDNTGRIARVVVHPTTPDVVFACALGHAYGPQRERGVFRTTDGGRTWEHVLFVDENTGCSDLAIDPTNPRSMLAGMWQLEIHTWGRESGGPGSGVFRSLDGGTTWERLVGNGLPSRPVGKIGLAIARSNPRRIYALIETGDGVPWHGQETDRGELWRSDDGGTHWQVVSYDRQLSTRQPYYTRMAVAPDNENEAYFLAQRFTKTLDGGATTIDVPADSSPGEDNHDIWIDPTNARHIVVGNDYVVAISVNRGQSWHHIELPIAQMYHVTTDNEIPYNVYGNEQDLSSHRGPSNSRLGRLGIPRGDWQAVGGSESGWAMPDTLAPNLIWSTASGSGSVGGIVTRYDVRTRQVQNVEVWPVSTEGHPAKDVKYRFLWTFPIAISPHDHTKVYVGSQHVHVTTNGGRSWRIISPDLTRNDTSRMGISGGLTPDNIGVEYAGVIFALAESPLQRGLIWAGTNDGLVHVTRNAGLTWTDVTANLPGLPPWGTISNIEPSRYSAGSAYLTVDSHQVNNRDPFVYRTRDYGRSWQLIVNAIPRGPLSYAHWIREDPVRQGLLYLGTENAIYVSFDEGQHWQPLQNNLPHAPVYGIALQPHFKDLVVGTYGRGFWILDDVTPLHQLTPAITSASAHLFVPRPAYRFRTITLPQMPADDPATGENPPYGAAINYWLGSAPDGPVTLSIFDAAGALVRTLNAPKEPGVNRVWWDLRADSSKQARLRTLPLYAPEVRLNDEGWRTAPGTSRLALLLPPGAYRVKLTVGSQELTQPLTVRKDPHSAGTEADIRAQYALSIQLRNDVDEVADMINSIETVRSQLTARRNTLPSSASAVRAAVEQLDNQLIDVEGSLLQLKLTGRGQDNLRWPAQLAVKLAYLANNTTSSDAAPTEQARAAHLFLRAQVREQHARADDVLKRGLQPLNQLLRELGMPAVETEAAK
jgi:hypothetical protein